MNAVIILIIIAAALVALFAIPALKGFRTRIFGLAVSVIGGVLPIANDLFGYLQGLDWTQYVSTKNAPFIMLAIGVIVIILRYLTTGPVGEK